MFVRKNYYLYAENAEKQNEKKKLLGRSLEWRNSQRAQPTNCISTIYSYTGHSNGTTDGTANKLIM